MRLRLSLGPPSLGELPWANAAQKAGQAAIGQPDRVGLNGGSGDGGEEELLAPPGPELETPRA